MIGYRIKIFKSGLDTYWYNNHIGKECWAFKDEDKKNYVVIQEGILYREDQENRYKNPNFGDKVVMSEDCVVIRSSHIIVDIVTTQKILDIFVKDLHIDRKPPY